MDKNMNINYKDETYTFTGFMPSGNPFLWYYDENKSTAFATSMQVQTWDKEPQVGDKIRMVADGWDNRGWIYSAIYINDKLVYRHSDEKIKEQEKITDDIYTELKRSKGLL
jgi:hypothetical protein